MNSRERILSAMECREVDYLPMSIYFNSNLEVEGYDLSIWSENIRLQHDLGCDPVIHLQVNNAMENSVERRCWRENLPGQGYPVQFEEFRTPAGNLRMGVKVFGGWPADTGSIPWGDESAGNLFEPLIKSPEDIEAFSYLHRPPGTREIAEAGRINGSRFAAAEKYGCATLCRTGQGLATYMFVMGAERSVIFSMDYPEAFSRLAGIDHEVNLGRIKAAAELGADIGGRFGGYEQTNFYSPAQFRKIVKPFLEREAEALRGSGMKSFYRVVSGAAPLLEDISCTGFDCIEGGEPRLDPASSFERWAQAFKGKCSCWTGVSSPVLLGRGDSTEVRREVGRAVEIFGRKGFILGVTNSIRKHFRWENTLAMIDEWKKLRK